MSYKALLFCPEEKTARVVTQVLSELDFQPEPCNELFTAVKKLTSSHFDTVVVDCDNEQNAGLLFKSALHSGSNPQSLAVAVVEDQSGVAMAFRLGANLVLTKPISLEQSRSTLRVARGLLRKNDGVKISTQGFQTASDLHFDSAVKPDRTVTKPVPPALQAATTSNVAAPASSILEVDSEPEPAPDASEAALLESMPDPLAGIKFSRELDSQKGSPWPTAARAADPESSARLDPAAKSAPVAEFAPTASPVVAAVSKKPAVAISNSGFATSAAAAAPARAKETPLIGEPEITEIEPPAFSALAIGSGAERFGGETNKKLISIAACALVVAGIAYAGWTKLHSSSSASGISQPAIPSHIAPPAPASEAETGQTVAADSTAPNPQRATTQVEQAPDITLSTEIPVPAKGKPTHSPASIPTKAAPAEAREVLVVSNATAKLTPPPAPAVEPETPPPATSQIASNSGAQAISGILATSTSTAVQPAHSIQLSQGVAQGLLIKQVQPTYSAEAHRLRLQGAVELLANISKDGTITNLKQLSGDRILGRAALDAVKQWKYKPYLLDGQPVEVQTQIKVNFNLQ